MWTAVRSQRGLRAVAGSLFFGRRATRAAGDTVSRSAEASAPALSRTPITVTLEGNIGAGKSTLLRILRHRLGAEVVHEPVERWQAVGGDSNVNLLDLFYKDPQRWGYTFQSFAFFSRLQSWVALAEERERRLSLGDQSNRSVQVDEGPSHVASQHPAVRVYERSVFSDRHVFAMNAMRTGLMNAAEWAVYEEWYRWLVSRFAGRIDGMVYIRTRPEVCYSRLVKRNRTEEASVPLSYLQQLHARHEEWLASDPDGLGQAGPRRVPVLQLDCSEEFEQDAERQRFIEQRIRLWLQHLLPADGPI